uniref:Uncharacterized protein n=1 Tax=Pithovirus LCPAC403 TaxID=2506596 RepID=A0A481ZFC2_9VIRU|nr:MAG: uncharacterized protein LCPAC403_03350 [Pithovirus LCPAC403]
MYFRGKNDHFKESRHRTKQKMGVFGFYDNDSDSIQDMYLSLFDENSVVNAVIGLINSNIETCFDNCVNGTDFLANNCVGIILEHYHNMESVVGFPESLRLLAEGFGPYLHLNTKFYYDVEKRQDALEKTKRLFSRPGENEIPATRQQKILIYEALISYYEAMEGIF